MNLWLSEGEGFFLVHAVYFSTLVLNLGLDMLYVVKPVAFCISSPNCSLYRSLRLCFLR